MVWYGRDATYTTQPLELLNSIRFDKESESGVAASANNSDVETNTQSQAPDESNVQASRADSEGN